MCYSQIGYGANAGGIGIKCGSVNDPPNKRGLAHLVEHLLFGGYDDESQLKVELDYYEKHNGGPEESAIVEIGHISTFFGTDTLLYRPHILDYFDFICDLIHRRKIISNTAELNRAIAREKAAIHNEFYLCGTDSISSLIDTLLKSLIYSKNPIHNRIDCELPEFKNITDQDVINFIRKWYVPKNMFSILIGPPLAEVKKITEKHFGRLTSASKPKINYDHLDDFPEISEIREKTEIMPGIHQRHIALGFPTETFYSKDAQVLDVLARILSFRLRMRLRNNNYNFHKGTYRVFASTERTYLHGLFSIWFATINPEFLKEGEVAIFDELKKLQEHLVTEREFKAIKKNMEWGYRQNFRDVPGNVVRMIVDSVCNGDDELVVLHGYLKNLNRVSRKKIRDIANKYFSNGFAKVIIRPE